MQGAELTPLSVGENKKGRNHLAIYEDKQQNLVLKFMKIDEGCENEIAASNLIKQKHLDDLIITPHEMFFYKNAVALLMAKAAGCKWAEIENPEEISEKGWEKIRAGLGQVD